VNCVRIRSEKRGASRSVLINAESVHYIRSAYNVQSQGTKYYLFFCEESLVI
jgi:hypothetical protein